MSKPDVPGMKSIGVRIAGTHIGDAGTVESLKKLLETLTAADVVQAAAKILIALEKPGAGLLGQQEPLIQRLFPGTEEMVGVSTLSTSKEEGPPPWLITKGKLQESEQLAWIDRPEGHARGEFCHV